VFSFRFTRPYVIAGLPFGVTPWTTGVDVVGDRLEVRFGPWRLRTPVSNVASTQVTGPFTFIKTAGPAHLSFTDHGVTFATNGERGLCIVLHEPVRAINPVGPPSHPNLTVTVAEFDRLAEKLAAPG
jgi:hypothetical protein